MPSAATVAEAQALFSQTTKHRHLASWTAGALDALGCEPAAPQAAAGHAASQHRAVGEKATKRVRVPGSAGCRRQLRTGAQRNWPRLCCELRGSTDRRRSGCRARSTAHDSKPTGRQRSGRQHGQQLRSPGLVDSQAVPQLRVSRGGGRSARCPNELLHSGARRREIAAQPRFSAWRSPSHGSTSVSWMAPPWIRMLSLSGRVLRPTFALASKLFRRVQLFSTAKTCVSKGCEAQVILPGTKATPRRSLFAAALTFWHTCTGEQSHTSRIAAPGLAARAALAMRLRYHSRIRAAANTALPCQVI